MAKDFKAEEEELDSWFDEEKEKLTKDYNKKLENVMIGDGEEEGKKAKKKKDFDKEEKVLEKRFISSMGKLRHTYQKRYTKLRTSKDKYDEGKKTRKVVLKPFAAVFLFVFNLLKKLFMAIFDILKKIFGAVKSCVFSGIGKAWYVSKENFTFHLKPKLMPVYSPAKRVFNIFFRPVRKSYIKLAENISEGYKAMKQLLKKAWASTAKAFQKTAQTISKYAQIVTGFIDKIKKKITEFCNKYFKPVLDKFKKKKKE